MPGLDVRRQHAVPGERHCSHHPVGADRDDAIAVGEPQRAHAVVDAALGRAQRRAGGPGQHRLHDVPVEGAVLRPRGLEAWRLVAAPDDHVGRGFDLRDLVAVDPLLVAGEVQHPGACRAKRRADREQHRVAQAAAGEHDGLAGCDLRGRAGRAHQHHRLARRQPLAEVGGAAHLQHDGGDQPACPVDPGTGERQTLHREARRREAGACDPRRMRLEVLQPIELAGLELRGGQRRVHHHLDDVRREPLDAHHAGAQQAVQARGEDLRRLVGGGFALREHPGDHRPALLGRAHRLDHVAEPARMHVAEVRDPALCGRPRHQHARLRGLGALVLGLDRVAVLVERAEIAPVQGEVVRILAREHGVGLRAGGDEDAARGQHGLALGEPAAVGVAVLARERDRSHGASCVDVDAPRIEAFCEADAFLERFLHLLMVQRVRGCVEQPLAVGEGHAAPAIEQLDDPRRPAVGARRLALGADRPAVCEELVGELALLFAPAGAHRRLAQARGERFVAQQELVDLHDVVGERLGGGVDRGEAAADHHDRQAQLHVRDRLGLGRAGQLQRHQEVARGAHAARQAVRDVERRRAPCADGERDMVEAQAPGVLDAERAAEAHAADQREPVAPLEEQTDQLEEVLVPAHRDAVLGHAAEAGQRAVVERLAQRGDVAYRAEGHARAVLGHARERGRQRLDLEPVDRDHLVAVVHQVVCEREARGAGADHQHAPSAVGGGQRAPEVQRIPARQQRIDLEAPG